MSSLKKYLILGILIVLLIVGFTSCKWLIGIFSTDAPDDNGEDAEKCDYPLSPPTGNVGDTIRSCHFEVTLHKAEYIDIEYRGPRVVVHATIKLVKLYKGAGASIFQDSFIIEDGQGNWYKWDGLGGDDGLQQTILGEGQTISGTSTITVGKDSSNFTAVFQESQKWQTAGYKDKIKWKLGF